MRRCAEPRWDEEAIRAMAGPMFALAGVAIGTHPGEALQMPRSPTPTIAEVLERLGIPREEVDRMLASGDLSARLIERLFLPGEARYDREEVARRTGVAPDEARRLWRGLGLPEVAPGEKFYTESDVEALRRFGLLVSLSEKLSPGLDLSESIVPFVRVFGSAIAGIAAGEVDLFRRATGSTGKEEDDAGRNEALLAIGAYLDLMKESFDYIHRRHLLAATMQQVSGTLGSDGSQTVVTVGFADMVGFTPLTRHLSGNELAALVTRFTEQAYETISSHAGRVVKMIGDEVMFVAPDVARGAAIALELARSVGADPEIPKVRVGLATGPALHHEGDYFGAVVNVASRLVSIAEPGTVLVTDAVHDGLVENEEFYLKRVRPKRLKGVGEIPVWVLRRPRPDTPTSDPGRRRRGADRR